jgi:hypothetical protein
LIDKRLPGQTAIDLILDIILSIGLVIKYNWSEPVILQTKGYQAQMESLIWFATFANLCRHAAITAAFGTCPDTEFWHNEKVELERDIATIKNSTKYIHREFHDWMELYLVLQGRQVIGIIADAMTSQGIFMPNTACINSMTGKVMDGNIPFGLTAQYHPRLLQYRTLGDVIMYDQQTNIECFFKYPQLVANIEKLSNRVRIVPIDEYFWFRRADAIGKCCEQMQRDASYLAILDLVEDAEGLHPYWLAKYLRELANDMDVSCKYEFTIMHRLKTRYEDWHYMPEEERQELIRSQKELCDKIEEEIRSNIIYALANVYYTYVRPMVKQQ